MATDKELIRRLAKEGVPIAHIARDLGISRAWIYEVIIQSGQKHFRPIMPRHCIYPNWRNWMNENRVSRDELIRRMGWDVTETSRNRLKNWMIGKTFPHTYEISLLLKATGLSYDDMLGVKDGCYNGD